MRVFDFLVSWIGELPLAVVDITPLRVDSIEILPEHCEGLPEYVWVEMLVFLANREDLLCL